MSGGDWRLATFDLHAVSRSDIRPVIPNRLVMRAAIVPERDRVAAPAEAAGPFRFITVIDKELQDAITLEAGKFIYVGREISIDIYDFASRNRMPCDDWMNRDRRTRTKNSGAVMCRRQAFQILLHARRKCLIGRVHAGEHGVPAAIRRDGMIVEHAPQWRHGGAGLIRMEVLA